MTSATHPKAEETKETAEDTAGESAGENPVRYLCMKYNRYQEGDAVASRSDAAIRAEIFGAIARHYEALARRGAGGDRGPSA